MSPIKTSLTAGRVYVNNYETNSGDRLVARGNSQGIVIKVIYMAGSAQQSIYVGIDMSSSTRES